MGNAQQKSDEHPGLGGLGRSLTVAAIFLWIVIFLTGILIGSLPYRQSIASNEPNFLKWIANWIIVILAYTPTNIAILSILAGLLGALGRRATLHAVTPDKKEEYPEDRINPYISGVVRGFIVYLLIISGMIIVLEVPPLSPDGPEPYIRLASVISVISFIVSYDPRYFGKLLNRATKYIVKKGKESRK